MGVVIVEGEWAGLWVNLGCPIVTTRDLLHTSAVVCELIKLLFGVVSGVGEGMGVLDGVHVTQREAAVSGIFRVCTPLV